MVTGMDAALEEEREAARRGALLDKRRWRKDQREQLDEMLPKATGRFAKDDQRRPLPLHCYYMFSMPPAGQFTRDVSQHHICHVYECLARSMCLLACLAISLPLLCLYVRMSLTIELLNDD